MMNNGHHLFVIFVLLTSSLLSSTILDNVECNDTVRTHVSHSHKTYSDKNTTRSDEWFSFDDLLDFKYWDDGSSLYLKLYGNYGGYGNKGGKAWDDLDRVFQKHDYRYGKHGFLDAKSDARLLQEIPFVLFHKNIHKEGYVVGPAVFFFFATSLPSIYRLKMDDDKITIPLFMPNSSCALCAYKMEENIEYALDMKKLEKEFKRVKKKLEDEHENTEEWLKEQGEDAEDLIKKAF